MEGKTLALEMGGCRLHPREFLWWLQPARLELTVQRRSSGSTITARHLEPPSHCDNSLLGNPRALSQPFLLHHLWCTLARSCQLVTSGHLWDLLSQPPYILEKTTGSFCKVLQHTAVDRETLSPLCLPGQGGKNLLQAQPHSLGRAEGPKHTVHVVQHHICAWPKAPTRLHLLPTGS